MNKSCGEALMHLLEAYGVDTVFGIPGEHTLELYRGIEKSQKTRILPPTFLSFFVVKYQAFSLKR